MADTQYCTSAAARIVPHRPPCRAYAPGVTTPAVDRPLPARPVAPAMRWLIVAGALLVLGAGSVLVFAPAHTDRWFVFQIQPPVTAVFLGTLYWAACVVELLSLRQRRWCDVRAPMPGVFAFTVLVAIVSLLNLNQFDLARPASWVWLCVYLLYPIALLSAYLFQRRVSGLEPARAAPLPVPIRLTLGVAAATFLAVGVALIVYPQQAGAWWAWVLTPPNAAYRSPGGTSLEPYVGCWLVGLGAVAVASLREDDAARLIPVFAGALALGALQALTIGLYPASFDWSRPATWAFVVGASAFAIVGAAGLALARRARIGDDSIRPADTMGA